MTTALVTLLVFLAASPQPTCTLPEGSTIRIELAATDEERAIGLMFRDVVPADTGMLFLFPNDGIWPFWMKDTMVGLDFIWLDATGQVVEVRADVPPCRVDPCPSYAPSAFSRAMLEMAAGSAEKHGIKVGVRLRFSGVPGYPDLAPTRR